MQRNVEVTFLRLENSGKSWIGTLSLKTNDKKKISVAELMVEHGLAWVDQYFGTAGLESILKIEAKARNDKRGIWALENPCGERVGTEPTKEGEGEADAAEGEDVGEESNDPKFSYVPGGVISTSPSLSGKENSPALGSSSSYQQPEPQEASQKRFPCRVVDVIDSGM
jgi:hypothetical protein